MPPERRVFHQHICSDKLGFGCLESCCPHSCLSSRKHGFRCNPRYKGVSPSPSHIASGLVGRRRVNRRNGRSGEGCRCHGAHTSIQSGKGLGIVDGISCVGKRRVRRRRHRGCRWSTPRRRSSAPSAISRPIAKLDPRRTRPSSRRGTEEQPLFQFGFQSLLDLVFRHATFGHAVRTSTLSFATGPRLAIGVPRFRFRGRSHIEGRPGGVAHRTDTRSSLVSAASVTCQSLSRRQGPCPYRV